MAEHTQVKCNACGHVGDYATFPKGRNLFQQEFIAQCPKCDNREYPGSASMSIMPNYEPKFTILKERA